MRLHLIPVMLAAMLIEAPTLTAATLSQWNVWMVDTGNHFVSNVGTNDFSGYSSIDYDGDLNYCTFRWSTSTGQCWPRCGKGERTGSAGYPKRVDSISGGKWCTYNVLNNGVSGSYQTGMYIWLDDSSPSTWSYTHEINIWNKNSWNSATLDSSWTWIGAYNADGSNYSVYKKWNTYGGSYWSWQVIRWNQKYDMSLDIKDLLDWLRQRGLPNEYVIEITPCIEGYEGSSGNLAHYNINIPNL